MNLRRFTVGPLLTNCYLVWCGKTNTAIMIDPGFNGNVEARNALDLLRSNGLRLDFIVDTHGHPDHTCGNGIMKSATGAEILIHELDATMLGRAGRRMASLFGFGEAPSVVADGFLKDGEDVMFGEEALRVSHTPGHSPGSVSLLGEDCVFTGDTLFAGSIGRVDLPGSSSRDIMKSLHQKLVVLPDSCVVYPGHGPSSTIGNERRSNAFLQKGFDTGLLG